ncbi:MAG: phosphoribosylanthranilate isomerase [Rhodospirillales bacterium]|nr:phosphoribosylanthranilate isomerase [Rhodospirillales bacterium]
MTVDAKICGINDAVAMEAAVSGRARYVGLVFYPPSPRYVSPSAAAELVALASTSVTKVGLFVDANDQTINDILRQVPLDMLQCHGGESPARINEIRDRFGLPVMKAIGVAAEEDLVLAQEYEDCADWLLFDAKPPKSMPNALPGGNALVFDWKLMAGRKWSKPWMLSGGLEADNVAEAVNISGARVVDVSSGVESRPGIKSPERIALFLDAVRSL